MTKPLEGLVVLDVSTGCAGAMASMMLSDLGARVLRAVTADAPLMRADGFAVWDRGKEAIAMDIATQEGQAQFDSLIPGLDVLIEDQPPSSPLQPLFAAQRLAGLNPHLVSCSITGYGMQGPWKDDAPDDDLVLARAGLNAATPGFRGSPAHLTFRIPSASAAVCASAGIAAALHEREASGHGRRIETSLLGATLIFTPKVSGPGIPAAHFQRHPGSTEPFYGVYRCNDGLYINLGCFQTDMVFACARILGLTDLLAEPRFCNGRVGMAGSQGMSLETDNELRAAIAGAIAARDSEYWMEALAKAGIPFAPVRGDEDSLDDPQVIHNAAVCTLDDPELGPFTQMGALSRFFETAAVPDRPRSAVAAPPPRLEAIRMRLNAQARLDQPPLAGVRVLEVTNIVAGPAGGRLLADMGADVIKLEPPAGDIARSWVRTYFYHLNFGKRSLCIDSRKPGGDEVLKRLVSRCDALLANVRPGAIERMGIGPHLNPALVESHVTAFGWTGPYASRPGLDPMAQALTGHHLVQGGEGNPPSCLNLIAPTDYMAGVIGALNLIVGLYARRRLGVAQKIETNLLGAGIFLNSAWFTRYAGKPRHPLPDRGQHGLSAFGRLYRLADGWLRVSARNEREQEALLAWLGVTREDKAQEGVHPAESALARTIESAFAGRHVARAEGELRQAGVPAAQVMAAHSEAFLEHPHAAANGFVEALASPEGETRLLRNFVHFTGVRREPTPAFARQGQHTDTLLAEAGFNEQQIRDLHSAGVAVSPSAP